MALLVAGVFCPLLAQNWERTIVDENVNASWALVAQINTSNIIMDPEGDSWPDLFAVIDNKLCWYENKRPGWEKHIIDILVEFSANLRLQVSDLDDDGDDDIMYMDNMQIGWVENTDKGKTWVHHSINYYINSLVDFTGLAGWAGNMVADLDNDGDKDIFLNLRGKYMEDAIRYGWLENLGTDNWSHHAIRAGWDGESGSTYNGEAWSTISYLDDDDIPDIILSPSFNAARQLGIMWCENPGNTTKASDWEYTLLLDGGAFSSSGHPLDIDGDGDKDLLVADHHSEAIIYYENPGWKSKVIVSDLRDVLLGPLYDLDNDGDDDITYGSRALGYTLGWIENTGTGWVHHIIDDTESRPQIISGIMDINDDGSPDIVTSKFNPGESGDIRWYSIASTTTSLKVKDKIRSGDINISPNPSYGEVILDFTLKEETRVKMTVMDLSGRVISVSMDRNLGAGKHSIIVNTCNDIRYSCDSGLYFFHFNIGKYQISKKVMLIPE